MNSTLSKIKKYKLLILGIGMLFCSFQSNGQGFNSGTLLNDVMSRFSGFTSQGGGPDTTSPRPANEGLIHILQYTIANPTLHPLDTTVAEINKDYLMDPYYINLGAAGSATKPIYFDFDPTINLRYNNQAFALYEWNADKITFYQQDVPLTKLGFTSEGDNEFHYFAKHSRNLTKTWNAALAFRLTSTDGKYKNQKSNIANFYASTNYISKNNRLKFQAAWATNSFEIQENGGLQVQSIQKAEEILNNPTYTTARILLPVNLGTEAPSKKNYFNDFVAVGRIFKSQELYAYISYDLGTKESFEIEKNVYVNGDTKKIIAQLPQAGYDEVEEQLKQKGLSLDYFDTTQLHSIPDSVTVTSLQYQFYPRVRLFAEYKINEVDHTFKDDYYNKKSTFGFYNTSLKNANLDAHIDSAIVLDKKVERLRLQDKIVQQYAKLGTEYFFSRGNMDNFLKPYVSYHNYNVWGQGSIYQFDLVVGSDLQISLWKGNVSLKGQGQLTIAGWHVGDNSLSATFYTRVPQIKSSLTFGAFNMFRSAPLHFLKESSFFIANDSAQPSWNKEQLLHVFGKCNIEFLNTEIRANNYLFTNLFYLKDYVQPRQSDKVVNVTQLSVHNRFTFFKYLHWWSDIWLQLSSDTSVISIPNLITRQRLFVGGRAYKTVDVAVGIEALLIPDFYPQGYAPLQAEWFYQNQEIKSTTTTISLFTHLKIKNFFLYLRLEQLNTVNVEYNDGAFRYPEKNNSSFVYGYYYPGFNIRLGFFWNLVN